jgi:NarL family two-component system response regulator LiaR
MVLLKTIRVMIVDDHEVVRRGLASYVESAEGLELVASVGSGDEALRVCSRARPDIILMDIVMPGMDGIETTRRIRALLPDVKVLALTAHLEPEAISLMMESGAVGYLLKTTAIDDLPHVIRTTYAGRMTFSPEVAATILSQQQLRRNPYGLTEREIEVLKLVTEGNSNPEIAEKLVISRSTVGYHVSSIINKLGVSNRVEASLLAIKENLISL